MQMLVVLNINLIEVLLMNTQTNMGLASNERREQRIMKLRNMFNHQEVVTVESAVQKTGYSAVTIRKWAKSGDIPLIDTEHNNQPVVPMHTGNKPKWLK